MRPGKAPVFTSDVDRRGTALRERMPGIVLGTLALVMLAAALVSARTIPFLLGAAVVGFLVRAAASGRTGDIVHRPLPIHLALAAFLGWALVSLAWSEDVRHGLSKLAVATVVVLGATAMIDVGRGEDRANRLHIAEGIWIGLLVGLCYFLFEILSGQALKIWIYNLLDFERGELPRDHYYRWRNGDLVYISPVDLTRNTTSITLVMWAAMLAALGSLGQRAGRIVAGLVLVLSTVVVALSEQETSKLAILAGLATFGAAILSRAWTGRLMLAGWLVACLGAMPLAMAMHRLDLHNAAWVPPTGQHRIIIWNHTAEQALASPMLGVGMHSTYAIGPSQRPATRNAPGERLPRTLSRHAHNIYLQTWFELGAIGALLLSIVGVAVLGLIRRLDDAVQPYALATFACGAVIGAASYGMWQIWYMAMYGMAFALIGLAAQAYGGRPAAASDQRTEPTR